MAYLRGWIRFSVGSPDITKCLFELICAGQSQYSIFLVYFLLNQASEAFKKALWPGKWLFMFVSIYCTIFVAYANG